MSESNGLNSDIKSMKLYRHVDRVLTELQCLGKGEQGPLSASELTPFDQLHYHGTESVDEAVRATGITAGSSVLEIGSGLGGPARHIAPQQVPRLPLWNCRLIKTSWHHILAPVAAWQEKWPMYAVIF